MIDGLRQLVDETSLMEDQSQANFEVIVEILNITNNVVQNNSLGGINLESVSFYISSVSVCMCVCVCVCVCVCGSATTSR